MIDPSLDYIGEQIDAVKQAKPPSLIPTTPRMRLIERSRDLELGQVEIEDVSSHEMTNNQG